MDENGFLFTTDATLALVVVIVFTASIVTYQILPIYNGEDHQHLEALADSAMSVMEQDGTLRTAAVYYANNNSAAAQSIITDSLNSLMPPDVTYKMTLGGNPGVTDPRASRSTAYGDMVTKVKVISGPQEGWVGRAYYKLEEVKFDNQQTNVTTTAWNFHNWLTNYSPWSGSNHLQTYPYWGSGSVASPIAFSLPNGATMMGGTFLLGSNNGATTPTNPKNPSYGANVVINGLNHQITNTSFTFLNNRLNAAGTAITGATMYNYQGNLTAAELHSGANNLYINYRNNVAGSLSTNSNMPWFALLAKYTTTIQVPQGILTDVDNFTDTAGVAIPTALNLNGSGNSYGFTYNILNQQKTYFTTRRSIAYGTFFGADNPTYSDGTPFVLTGIPFGASSGTAVSKVTDINIPAGARIFDGYVVVNAYGAVDDTVIEVWNGTVWQTVFNSDSQSAITDGYGNTPGIIYIKDYLRNGNNKVRVTVWDQAPSSDYDFVGIINSYAVTTYSRLPVKWDNFPFTSHQSNTQTETQTRTFTVGADAQKALLFVGVGSNSRHIQVRFNNTGPILYDSDTIPFSLDIGDLDAAGSHVMTNGVPGNYSLKTGTYNLKVTVTAPNNAWEAGDSTENNNNGKAIMYSGTRVAILYPKFLQNIWTTSYANSAGTAQAQAKQDLIDLFTSSGIPFNPDYIKTEAMYTGDLPNAIPVRLDLWK